MFHWAAFFSLSSSESWMTFWGLGCYQVTSIPCDIYLTSHTESKEDTTLENAFKVEASMALWEDLERLGPMATSWGCFSGLKTFLLFLCVLRNAKIQQCKENDLWKIPKSCVLCLLVLHVCNLLTVFFFKIFLIRKQ